MSNTVIHRMNSAKLRKVKDQFVLDVEFDEITTTEGGEVFISSVTKSGPKPVHEDLLKTLKVMVPHFLILSDQRKPKEFNKAYFEKEEAITDKTIEKFSVYGLHFKEKNDVKYVILLGRMRIPRSNRMINMPLPMESMDLESENVYENIEQLVISVDKFLDEVEQYMSGKYAPTLLTGDTTSNQLKVA